MIMSCWSSKRVIKIIELFHVTYRSYPLKSTHARDVGTNLKLKLSSESSKVMSKWKESVTKSVSRGDYLQKKNCFLLRNYVDRVMIPGNQSLYVIKRKQ